MADEKVHTTDDATKLESQVGDADTVLVGAGVKSSTGGIIIAPYANGTTAVKVMQSDESTVVASFDTTNKRLYVGGNSAPAAILDLATGGGAGGVPPIRLPSAVLTTAGVPGAIEYDGTDFWATAAGPSRAKISTGGASLIGYTHDSSTDYNTAVGVNAGDVPPSGYRHTCFGYNAGTAITSGYDNTCVGWNAGAAITGNQGCTCVGSGSGQNSNTSYSTFVGYEAGRYRSGQSNTACGYRALGTGSGAGSGNVGVGSSAGSAITSGGNNTFVGTNAGSGQSTSDGCVAIGYSAQVSNNSTSISIGFGANNMSGGYQNIFIGYNCGGYNAGGAGNGNVGVGGDNTFYSLSSGTYNTAIGDATAQYLASGTYNTMLGAGAGSYAVAAINYAICIGSSSGYIASASDIIAIGRESIYQIAGTGCVAVGYRAITRMSGGYNTAVGNQALAANNAAGYNTAVGYQAGYTASGNYNCFFGYLAGYSASSGTENVAIGHNALYGISTSANNIGIGYGAGYGLTGGDNTSVGYQAGYWGGTATGTAAFGYRALYALTNGTYNTAMGHSAALNLTTANYAVAIGYQAMGSSTVTGDDNIAIGRSCLMGVTSGSSNIAIGYNALVALTGGTSPSGTLNVAVGPYAGQAITTGYYNVCLGANSDVGRGSYSNVAIGYSTVADGDYYCVQIGRGSNSTNSRCQFGDPTYPMTCYGSGVWNTYSDLRLKKDVANLELGLTFIESLRPVSFVLRNAATDYQKLPQFGFIAQEVSDALELVEAGPCGVVEAPASEKEFWGMSYDQLIAPLVKAVQELSAEVKDLRAEVVRLKGGN
jgi:hypothetical protein